MRCAAKEMEDKDTENIGENARVLLFPVVHIIMIWDGLSRVIQTKFAANVPVLICLGVLLSEHPSQDLACRISK